MSINDAISKITGTERDYEHCLNAMYEAEKVLTLTQFRDYIERLEEVTGADCQSITARADKFLIHATAAQRAEAFLRTLGKWEA